jgi:hypothetical protein
MQNINTSVVPRGLRQDVLDKIVGDPVLQGYVAIALGKSSQTVVRLAKNKHMMLTQVASLRAISKYLGVQDINELLEQVAVA